MAETSAIAELRAAVRDLAVPDACEVLAFGSALSSHAPNDLDVLIVHRDAPRASLRALRDMLEARAELGHVHVTVLTAAEEATARFVEEVGAVHIGGDLIVVADSPL